ncbi:MAG: response regulator [Candidatus Moraniibacteriota bacterium]
MRKKVIVVDDEMSIVNLVSSFLRTMGWEVFEFSDTNDVIDVVSEINPRVDFLITDFVMPGKNGAELIKIIKEKKPQIKAMCMSGFNKEAESGFDEFISKPFTFKEFKAKVDKLFPPLLK